MKKVEGLSKTPPHNTDNSMMITREKGGGGR